MGSALYLLRSNELRTGGVAPCVDVKIDPETPLNRAHSSPIGRGPRRSPRGPQSVPQVPCAQGLSQLLSDLLHHTIQNHTGHRGIAIGIEHHNRVKMGLPRLGRCEVRGLVEAT